VEIKIGISDSPREIAVDSEETHESIHKAVEKAINDGGMLSLTDDRGRTVLVPAAKIADVISADTGLRLEQAMLLGSGLQGLAQVAATRWLYSPEPRMPIDEAADLVSALAWRGIRSFPLSHPPE